MDKEKLSVDWAIELAKDILDGKAITDKVRQLIDEVEKKAWAEARKFYLSIFG